MDAANPLTTVMFQPIGEVPGVCATNVTPVRIVQRHVLRDGLEVTRAPTGGFLHLVNVHLADVVAEDPAQPVRRRGQGVERGTRSSR